MAFESYVKSAAEVATSAFSPSSPITLSHPLLNGAPYKAFRETIDLGERRRDGTFFSSRTVSAVVAAALSAKLCPGSVVMDPACGMGDLLLAYASHLPIGATLQETLELWGVQLAGLDKRPELAQLTKIRLVLLARARGLFFDGLATYDHFPMIKSGDLFDANSMIQRTNGFLFNPPFGAVDAPRTTSWAEGQVNAAALFLEKLCTTAADAAPISAVLPEVLRCGTRYRRFRERLGELGYGGAFVQKGRFDTWADVDVFTTVLQKNTPNPSLWIPEGPTANSTVASKFKVHVGAVVPHRDPCSGPNHPYICARTTPAWAMEFAPISRRLFEGRTFDPPFVAIRRTSSPSDKSRAVGTTIVGGTPVAVENHLLVALPTGTDALSDCHLLLRLLHSDSANVHLNATMRCRHLTTRSILSLPWRDVGD